MRFPFPRKKSIFYLDFVHYSLQYSSYFVSHCIAEGDSLQLTSGAFFTRQDKKAGILNIHC